MGTGDPASAPTYHRASEDDALIRAHIAEEGGGVDEPVVYGTTHTVIAVWRAFQRVRGDRRGFRVHTPDLTEDQRMAVIRFVGKYPHYVLPPTQSE
ncbi:MAG: hypothetical protein CL878_08440 [Dehalococcoidia bacterium]|nr:hypothetical protein [Dehalococcoidia bacterium]